ncbi:hypothetical protein O7627_25750 [Solwaraspora sp. WMMD1047]|uniref:hypothetical protein n=1 Tax=Solwaraspora sp. WMMD1047 TaxID=3016102 RepID=UPI002415D5DA|nr:hypothetical protein [Solwaraspora sp. WMMD1047]MDG4832687.1 hypothetical protein [Solwaraspora sp. WMMD1047]
MNLATVYRSIRRPAALGLGFAALVTGILAAVAPPADADRTLLFAVAAALIVFGVGGILVVALRPASHRRDTVLFFLAGAAAAALAGSGLANPVARTLALVVAVAAVLLAVLATLMSAERSLDDPRSRF